MAEPTTRLCHVLVADDEPHIGRIIKMKLEQGPFRVSIAYDGQEALDFINNEEQQFLTKPFSPKKLYALVARLTGAPDEAGISGE